MKSSADDLNPPAWADAVLRLLLKPEHRESVSGDLLEEYRESIAPALGQRRADAWYVRQVAGFLWRATWPWGVLFGAAGTIRSALDWFVPPETFYTRASLTTYFAISLFLAAGFWTSWWSRSLRASALAGIGTAVIAAAIHLAGTAVMLAVWHDPQTLGAIQRSGGLSEALTLPIVVILPAAFLATIGGVVGKSAASLFRSHAAE